MGIIAPFWATTDTNFAFINGHSKVYYQVYRQTQETSNEILAMASNHVKSYTGGFDDFAATWVLVVTWEKLCPYVYYSYYYYYSYFEQGFPFNCPRVSIYTFFNYHNSKITMWVNDIELLIFNWTLQCLSFWFDEFVKSWKSTKNTKKRQGFPFYSLFSLLFVGLARAQTGLGKDWPYLTDVWTSKEENLKIACHYLGENCKLFEVTIPMTP